MDEHTCAYGPSKKAPRYEKARYWLDSIVTHFDDDMAPHLPQLDAIIVSGKFSILSSAIDRKDEQIVSCYIRMLYDAFRRIESIFAEPGSTLNVWPLFYELEKLFPEWDDEQ